MYKKNIKNIHHFNKLSEQLFNDIEEKIDNYHGNSDIDYENNYNIITLTFENKSKIIINKQEPLFQIWLATMNSGYHFEYVNDTWICNRTQKNFWDILEQSCSNQSNEIVKLTNYKK
ncbi:MAG: iron donor protein CyaY [Buchnera aphidicola (Schlechtendalia peitan)]